MKIKEGDSALMIQDDIRHLEQKKRDAEEKSAVYLMKANDLDEKITNLKIQLGLMEAK